MGVGQIVTVTYGVIAMIVFIVLVTRVVPQYRTVVHGPHGIEEDIVISLVAAILWLPALMFVLCTALYALLTMKRKRRIAS